MIAGYVRVSTLRQAQDGVSIDMQKDVLIKHALTFELIVKRKDMIFYVDDGYSGKSLNRPKMLELINDIKQGKIEVVFAYDLSRISRDMFDSATFLKLLKNHGVPLKCIYDDPRMKTASDRYSTNIKILSNQYERERVVERTNDSLKSIAESGRYPIGGKMLYGYKRGADKDIYINDDQAEIVRRIFEMASEHYSLLDIASTINTLQKGRVFHPYLIGEMLKDERYIGKFTYKGKHYDNIVPAIVNKELQDAALKFYRKQKYKDNGYIFDGLLYCSSCGKAMTDYLAHGRNKKYHYYYCKNCRQFFSQVALDKYFSDTVLDLTSRVVREKEIYAEKRALEKRLRKLKSMYLTEKVGLEYYVQGSLPLEERTSILTAQLQAIRSNTKNTAAYSTLKSVLDKKEFINTYIKAIYVDCRNKSVINVEFVKDDKKKSNHKKN